MNKQPELHSRIKYFKILAVPNQSNDRSKARRRKKGRKAL